MRTREWTRSRGARARACVCRAPHAVAVGRSRSRPRRCDALCTLRDGHSLRPRHNHDAAYIQYSAQAARRTRYRSGMHQPVPLQSVRITDRRDTDHPVRHATRRQQADTRLCNACAFGRPARQRIKQPHLAVFTHVDSPHTHRGASAHVSERIHEELLTYSATLKPQGKHIAPRLTVRRQRLKREGGS